jgi:hypothetical protein
MVNKNNYEQQIAIVAGIRRAFEKCKHHQQFSKRVKPIIEAELPGYTVSVDPDHHGLRTINVWGNGLEYKDSVYLCWNGSKPWTEGMAEAIEISDVRDYAERLAAEAKLTDVLSELEKLVVEARAQAATLIENLPVPKAATIRSEHPTWKNASGELRARFPHLFESIGR